ncbi:hypothetical protein ACQKD8_22305 [Pseudomonas sp. NPDC077405]
MATESSSTKKIKDLTVLEWLAKAQAGYEQSFTITLHPNGSGTIHKVDGQSSYFHAPEDLLHWLGDSETEVPV